MKEIIDLIELKRKAAKIGTAELAAIAGISRATYWRFLNDKGDINLSSLKKIFDKLEIKILCYSL